jgi:hypothetical protein
MELRFLLKSGHSVALGVLALRAVQSALTLAMPTGGDSPPMGWTPMLDPARRRARPGNMGILHHSLLAA